METKNEEWRDVRGFEGSYQVSNMGRVRSLDRYVVACHFLDDIKPHQRFVRGRILRQHKLNNGYRNVTLAIAIDEANYINGSMRSVAISTHRLVAMHFVPGYAPDMMVNHKNEIKDDNRAENLEWCTPKYNQNYGTGRQRQIDTISKRVAQINQDGKIIAVYKSAKDAAKKTGYNYISLTEWCRGKHEAKNEFKWSYI